METKKLQYLLLLLLYSLVYFLVTTSIFYLSLFQNSNGITIELFGGGDDGYFYYEQAKNLANGIPYVYTSIHTPVLGIILKIFSTDSVYLLRFFNYIANVCLLLIALLLLKKLNDDNQMKFLISAPILILLLVCYPSLILNTTLSIYRDVWIYLFFILSMYLFGNIFVEKGKYPRIIYLIFLVISMSMLFGYRKYALLSFLIGSLIYIVLTYNKKKEVGISKALIYLLLGFSLFYIFLKDFKIPFVNLSFSDVLAYRQSFIDTYSGGSQMNISLEHSNIILFYLNYLYSLLSNIIGPFPWQINGISTLFLFLSEGILFVFILIMLFRNRSNFSDFDKYLLIQSIVWFMLISISNDNFGAGSRLRIVGWLPLLILFAKYFGESMYIKRSKQKQSL